MEPFLYTFATIALCLHAIHMLVDAFHEITKGKLRDRITDTLSKPYLSGLYGIIFTGFTGDQPSLFAVLVGMVRNGLIPQANAYTTFVWGNVGLVIPVYLTAINVKLIVYFLMIVSTLLLIFFKSDKWRPPLQAIFALSLILYSLQIIKGEAGDYNEIPMFQELMGRMEDSLAVPILFGLVVRFFGNSLMILSIVGAICLKNGIFSHDQLILYIAGSSLESVIILTLAGFFFKNYYRRFNGIQILYNVIQFLLFTTLVIIERASDTPFLTQHLYILGSTPELVTVNTLMIYNLVGTIIMMALKSPIIEFISQAIPIDTRTASNEPKYINSTFLNTPGMALDMLEKEHWRLLDKLPYYFEATRSTGTFNQKAVNKNNDDFDTVSLECSRYLNTLLGQKNTQESVDTLLNYLSRQNNLRALNKLIHNFTLECRLYEPSELTKEKIDGMTEALETMIFQLKELFINPSEETYKMYFGKLRDRGGVIEQIRLRYLTEAEHLEKIDQLQILDITLCFEQIQWVIIQLAQILSDPTGFQEKQAIIRKRWEQQLFLDETSSKI